MHTDFIMDADGQHTQVGPDPLDYVLRYTAGDYDCYHQGRYIGSRSTLPKAPLLALTLFQVLLDYGKHIPKRVSCISALVVVAAIMAISSRD